MSVINVKIWKINKFIEEGILSYFKVFYNILDFYVCVFCAEAIVFYIFFLFCTKHIINIYLIYYKNDKPE